MKPRYAFALLVAAALFLSLGTRNPTNPPLATTGAPGESTCQNSNCHNGGSYTANVIIDGLPDTIIAGSTYTFQLRSTNNNSVRGGFQITCLDLDNQPCGTFLPMTGVNVASQSGRSYARQATPQVVAANTTLWLIQWTAPNTEVGARFYASHLLANGNGNKNGDNVLTTTYNFEVTMPTSTKESAPQSLKIYPTMAQDQLTVSWSAGTYGQVGIYDLHGRLVSSHRVLSGMPINVAALNIGTYVVKIKTETGEASGKFIKM